MNKRKQNKKADGKFIAYENLDKIGEVAVYYGFFPAKSITITKADSDGARDLKNGDSIDD